MTKTPPEFLYRREKQKKKTGSQTGVTVAKKPPASLVEFGFETDREPRTPTVIDKTSRPPIEFRPRVSACPSHIYLFRGVEIAFYAVALEYARFTVACARERLAIINLPFFSA